MKKLTMLVAAAFAMTSAMAQLNPMEPIPADKDVRTGKLENGMTYYIRHNEKPKGQADFHILHDVGAIQENDAQQGLAHFLEHMAFNGTKNLPGKQMIEYLEKVGVKFGANLNAGTSWDMTSYMMKDVPTSREGIIDSALLILHDWSHFIALQPEEIDSERGVIMEELRTRDNASWRSTMKMLQALGKGTKYEHRNLIGYLDGLKGFQHKELEDFYNTWYRPDYQAVVIVGDIDVDAVENKLKTLMSDIPAPAADAAQKEVITVPDNEEPIVSIYTDPEMQGSRVQVFVKRPAVPEQYNNLVYGEMLDVVQAYMTTMENARLQEISMQPDAPFLGAGMNSGSIGVIPTLEATTFVAMTQDGKLTQGFEALYTEMEKVRRHGFTQGEFERAQNDLMRRAERSYTNRNDRRNAEFVQTYLDNFQQNRPMPDAKTEWQLDSMLIKALNVEAVNAFAQQAIYPNNQVIVITAPEKEGVENPTTEEILAIRDKVAAAEIEAYEDNTVKEPLIPEGTTLEGSPVKKTAQNAEYGTTEWTLANGVKVIVKPTAYKADEVRMSALAKGGLSILSDEEFYMGDDARLQLDVGRRQILGHRPQETAFGQIGVGSALGGELRQRHERRMLAQRPGDDVPVALPQLHAAAFRRERLQHAHEDAARTVGERQVEPRLPDGRQVHRRGIRQQPAPPDGFDRDHRQVQLRGAAGHLQETLSGCQQLRIQVRGQRRPRNAQTAR